MRAWTTRAASCIGALSPMCGARSPWVQRRQAGRTVKRGMTLKGALMRPGIRGAVFALGALVLGTGCATSEEWREWRAHTTHFASGQHGTFSLRNNKDGSNPRVSRRDIQAAQAETWWGKVITVSPDQIFERE